MNRVAILQHKSQFILHLQSQVRFSFHIVFLLYVLSGFPMWPQHLNNTADGWLVCVVKVSSQPNLATFVQRIFSIVLSIGLIKLCSFPQDPRQPSAMSTAVLQVCAEVNVFESLDNHMFDATCLSNHIFSLIKCCSQCYTKIKMYHLGKQHTDGLQDERLERGYRN